MQVTKDTMHDTLLPGQTVLESLEPIRSVMPLEVRSRDDFDNKEASKSLQRGSRFWPDEQFLLFRLYCARYSQRGIFKVNLTGLTPEQQ